MHDVTDIDDCWCSPPPSLQRWHELIHQYRAWLDAQGDDWCFRDDPEAQAIREESEDREDDIDDAWREAPMRDRARMRCVAIRQGWESFKKAMREARAEPRGEQT